MKVLEKVVYDNATDEQKEVLGDFKKKMGKVPNIYAAIANSPKALNALLQFGSILKAGEFSDKEIEAVALAVGEETKCDYCIAAHSALSKMAGLSKEDILSLRNADIKDNKLDAVAKLAKDIVAKQGHPAQGLIDKFFAAGYSKAAFVELIGLVSLNIFTNYFNHITEPEIDFPKV